MKPKFRDYLIIFFSLLAIFVCGSGVGFLIGEKSGREHSASSLVLPQNSDNSWWEERTMKRLASLLDLNAEQRLKVEAEVKATSEKILGSREEAVKNHYQSLLELHDKLLPHLDPEQRAKIKKDQESLQRAIDSRF